MKFTVASNELLKHLQIASGAIAPNPILPILEDFLFTLDKNKLTICSTDLEVSIIASLEVSSDSVGRVAIPAKMLTETVKALPQQPITISINSDYAIEITSAFGKYKLAGENGDDFPLTPEDENSEAIKLPGHVAAQGISKTLFATSNDDLRLAMTGVYFSLEDEALTFVSTDAHKLVRYSFKNIEGIEKKGTSFIIPKKALNLLKNALPTGEIVELHYNKTNAFFSFKNTRLICRLVDARYPDYNAVIPVESTRRLTISRQEFLNSLRRIAIYANKSTNQVVLNLSEKSLTISAQDLDFSNEATEQMNCIYEGEAMTIGFNAKFLVEMLNVMEGDEIYLELSTPSRAGILRPVNPVEGEDILMLVMPVILSN